MFDYSLSNQEEVVGMPAISQLLQSPGFEWDYSRYSHLQLFNCENQTEFEVGRGMGSDTWFQCRRDVFEIKNNQRIKVREYYENITRY
jgi:hypothetical protein